MNLIKKIIKERIREYLNESKYDYENNKGYTLIKKRNFNIQKLVDKKIIFVTKPGDGLGGIAEPNHEGDASIITLYNLEKPEAWMLNAIKNPMPQAIPYIQKYQDKLIYNGKYNQILWSINKKRLNVGDFL
jgi:hypothetical protein